MEDYSVVIYPSAQDDFRSITQRLDALSAESAVEQYDRFVEMFRLLTKTPGECTIAKDLQLRLRGYRTLQVGEYIVFFVLNRNIVELRRVLFAWRQYESLI